MLLTSSMHMCVFVQLCIAYCFAVMHDSADISVAPQVAIHWLDSNQDIQDISSWRGAHTRGRQDALKAMRLPYEVSAIQI